MKTTIWKTAVGRGRIALLASAILLPSCFCLTAMGQSYAVNWFKIAGGGGSSTGGNGGHVFSVSGTIGQPDAGGALVGGSYSLTGGFWSLVSVLQTAGTPNLTITRSGASVTVSWPATGNYILQQNSDLATRMGWATSGYEVTTNALGAASITLASPSGSTFFRLAHP